MSDLRSAALGYAGARIPIFPVHGVVDGQLYLREASLRSLTTGALASTPIYTGSFHEASTDREQIERWWTARPHANIGTSAFDVLDVDHYKDGAKATFSRLKPLITSTTPWTRTGGSGTSSFSNPAPSRAATSASVSTRGSRARTTSSSRPVGTALAVDMSGS